MDRRAQIKTQYVWDENPKFYTQWDKKTKLSQTEEAIYNGGVIVGQIC